MAFRQAVSLRHDARLRGLRVKWFPEMMAPSPQEAKAGLDRSGAPKGQGQRGRPAKRRVGVGDLHAIGTEKGTSTIFVKSAIVVDVPPLLHPGSVE